MTKEQEAIERLQDLRDGIRQNKIKVCELISEEGKYNLADDIETVLNMLKERDEEIENNKKKNKELSSQILKLYKEQDNYNARIENKNTELKKKDKQIDLMAITIIQRDIGKDYCGFNKSCEKCENGSRDLKCKECIKQYYESEVEE